MATPFDFEFTADQVSDILKNNPQAEHWYAVFVEVLPNFDINTAERVAAFLAQTCHESANYTALHENLNYRATSLIATWPKRFNYDNASQYEHNQEKIANKVYCDRMGNGDEASGDGWKYKGRGPIQITGKSNYAACSQALYGDDRLLDTPELLESDMTVAVQSACWFWSAHDLNSLVDDGKFDSVSYKINGGWNGKEDRSNRYVAAMTYLQDSSNA
jgi:putative chitinase